VRGQVRAYPGDALLNVLGQVLDDEAGHDGRSSGGRSSGGRSSEQNKSSGAARRWSTAGARGRGLRVDRRPVTRSSHGPDAPGKADRVGVREGARVRVVRVGASGGGGGGGGGLGGVGFAVGGERSEVGLRGRLGRSLGAGVREQRSRRGGREQQRATDLPLVILGARSQEGGERGARVATVAGACACVVVVVVVVASAATAAATAAVVAAVTAATVAATAAAAAAAAGTPAAVLLLLLLCGGRERARAPDTRGEPRVPPPPIITLGP
jgi:hypothetical protein